MQRRYVMADRTFIQSASPSCKGRAVRSIIVSRAGRKYLPSSTPPTRGRTEDIMSDTNTTAVITPTAAAKLVNAVLTEQQVPDGKGGIKQVRSQMLRNYTVEKVKNGETPLIAYTTETGIDRADLVRWLKQYIEKMRAKALGESEHAPLVLDEDVDEVEEFEEFEDEDVEEDVNA
jgi:hypothetical protein